MRRFNTTGPCDPEYHYMVPPERRLPEVGTLVDQRAYFVVHAPRQTGKTTTLQTVARRLTAEGHYAALYFTCEQARAFPEDVAAAERVIWAAVREAARLDLPDDLRPRPSVKSPPGAYLFRQLRRWARACPLPLVLFFDEIDSLSGDPLKSVLSQLRAGHNSRPREFPWSVVLCGMRDVRDYKAASGGGPVRLGSSSPFNVKAKSLRLGNFAETEVRELYAQYTAESGQPFAVDALARAWELTQGQPWLVNALAREIVEEIRVPRDQPITAAHVDEAKERLILARATHLDSLLARLEEERVRRVLEPVLAGELTGGQSFDADFEYVVDLGLVAPKPPVRIANPIYREVILRVLASPAESTIAADPRSYVAADGRLDMGKMLREFAAFWRENGEILAQLVFMAYLQRVVNGGGQIDREVGVGRRRIDLQVRWPYADAEGRRAVQRVAIELKVWRDRDKKGDPSPQGLAQLDEYLTRLGLDEGILVIFDARSAAPPIDDRTRIEEVQTPLGRRVTLLRA
jgi:hypothetical protein